MRMIKCCTVPRGVRPQVCLYGNPGQESGEVLSKGSMRRCPPVDTRGLGQNPRDREGHGAARQGGG